MPYDIDKQDCEQSDGDDGSYVLRYTDKKGKKHSNCHTSKKKAQGQIAAIEGPREMDETDDMVFGGGGFAADGEGEDDDGLEEALLRQWVREKLLAEVAATASHLFKDRSRVAAYLDQIKSGTPFELDGGGTIIIPEEGNDALVSALESNDSSAFNRAWKVGVKTSDGIKKSSGIIKKTPAFGGERAGKRLDKEDKQIGEIQAAIDAAGGVVNIMLGRRSAQGVTSIESVTGTPKADAVLKAGDEVVGAISLKYAARPNQMQQWGGVTKLYDAEIPAVVEFIKDVKYIEENSPSGRIDVTYFREIDDSDIATKICYGGGSWPEDDCDAIVASQTPITIDEDGNFIADHVWFNPEIPPGEWYPTLFARFGTGRGGGTGLKNVRLSLSPKGARVGEPLPARPPTPEVEAPADTEVEAAAEPVIDESILRGYVREKLLLEDLTRADRKEIERIFKKEMEKSKVAKKIIKKEIEAHDKKTIPGIVDKAFKKNFEKELKAALGVSFFGEPGKINKFVVDEIHDEVEKILGDKATKEMIVKICKDVIIKLYRELSFSYPQVIQRMKV